MLLPIISKHVPQCTVYLFGSRVRGEHREGADMDVAIDAGMPIDLKIILRIKRDIDDSRIPVFVDVIDVHSVSDRMRKEIERDGIVWND
jgi:predicted nucleotidyltransferase